MERLHLQVGTWSALRRMKLWSAVVVLGVAIVAAASGSSAAGASGGSHSAAKSSGSRVSTTLSFMFNFTPYGSEAPVYYAEALGYYKAQHINLVISQGKASTLTVTDVATGADEVGIAAPAAVAAGVEQGQKVVAIASTGGTGTFGFFIAKSTGIKSVKGLAGHSVLVPAGYTNAIAPLVLKAAGVNPASVQLITVAGSALLSTYAAGTGDAMATQIPFGNPLVQPKRPSYTFLWSKYGFSIPDFSLITTPSFLATHRAVVQGFVLATLKGYVAAQANPNAATRALLAAQPTLDKSIAEAQLKGILPPSLLCPPKPSGQPYGYQPPKDWSSMLSLLTKYGLVANDTYPASDMYTNTFFAGPHAIKTTTCPMPKVK